jgi:hypothetical protein
MPSYLGFALIFAVLVHAPSAQAYFDFGSLNAIVAGLGNLVVLALFSFLAALRFFSQIKSKLGQWARRIAGLFRSR